MLRTERIQVEQLEPIAAVVRRLVATGDVDAASLMIVGARCRDLLHAAYGHDFPVRATNDFDVAIATADLAGYERMTSKLTPISGSNGVRFLLDGLRVDLVPFGDVEDPGGTVRPARRPDGLNVWGFRDAYDTATPLALGGEQNVRLPNAAGFIALKLAAWIDRSERRDFRDASDIALGCYWYAEDDEVDERLYDTEDGQHVLVGFDLDVEVSAACLLGADCRSVVGAANATALREPWQRSPVEELVERFTHPENPALRANVDRRRRIVRALDSGMWPRPSSERIQ
jgi:predicted nucleotidyltransferase